MPLLIGTSGWQYTSWRGRFYPEKLPQRRWLPFYASRFSCVEVNNTFYNLPRTEVFEGWARAVPQDFTYVLKLSRYLTHIRRLRDPQDPVALFLERAAPLGGRMGALLLQLPPRFRCDPGRLDAALGCFPRWCRVAVEFRDSSWFTDEVRSILEGHGVALCRSDRGGRPQEPPWRTADWGFVRLHEGRASPPPCYGTHALESWTDRIASDWGARDDVFVFFNNDANSCAPRDAQRLVEIARRRGLPVPVPPAGDQVDDGGAHHR